MSEALIHLFPPLHGIWSSWARDQIRATAVAAPHLLTHCAWRGSNPLPQSSQDATNPFVPQWELQITLFFKKYPSARHFNIGLFMETNIAVIRLLYENPRGPLTIAETSSFKP